MKHPIPNFNSNTQSNFQFKHSILISFQALNPNVNLIHRTRETPPLEDPHEYTQLSLSSSNNVAEIIKSCASKRQWQPKTPTKSCGSAKAAKHVVRYGNAKEANKVVGWMMPKCQQSSVGVRKLPKEPTNSCWRWQTSPQRHVEDAKQADTAM